MYSGKLIFSQVMDHLPLHTFRRCGARYRGDRKVKQFRCNEQYRCMAFGQLTFRDSLRDVETCLRAQSAKLYHMGIRAPVARNTLANANQVRDWRIYADFAQALIAIARRLYAEDEFEVDLAQTVYALDATTIDLSLSVFPWGRKVSATVLEERCQEPFPHGQRPCGQERCQEPFPARVKKGVTRQERSGKVSVGKGVRNLFPHRQRPCGPRMVRRKPQVKVASSRMPRAKRVGLANKSSGMKRWSTFLSSLIGRLRPVWT